MPCCLATIVYLPKAEIKHFPGHLQKRNQWLTGCLRPGRAAVPGIARARLQIIDEQIRQQQRHRPERHAAGGRGAGQRAARSVVPVKQTHRPR